MNLGSIDPSSHCGTVLVGGEEENLQEPCTEPYSGVLALFHSENTSQHTAHAEACHSAAAKQAWPKAALACIHDYQVCVCTYVRTYVAGCLEARRGVPVDLTRHKERAHCGRAIISQGRGRATITRPRSLKQLGPGVHG